VAGAAEDGLAATITGTYGTKWNGNAGATSGGNFAVYRKATKAHEADGLERWERADMTDTLDANAMGAVAGTAILGDGPGDDFLLPLGLDSHRYRCCGNGVVSDVSEWIGLRLAAIA